MSAEAQRRNSAPATVVVERVGGFWKDRFRGYKVKVDGKVVGGIRENDTIALPVSPGDHLLQAKIDVFGSRTLTMTIDAGESKHFVCAAGNLDDFPVTKGYVKLWPGRLVDVRPPVDWS